MAYAEKTTVSVAKTKADIEELVQKAGAAQFIFGFKGNTAVIGFHQKGIQNPTGGLPVTYVPDLGRGTTGPGRS